jgi:hypothetical protein
MNTKKSTKATKKVVKSAKPKKIKAVKKATPVKKQTTKDITETVVDYKTACKHLKRKAVLPDFSMLPLKHQKSVIAYIILITIYEAWNEGWEPDFTNGQWDKYYVWIGVKKDPKHPSGFGLSSAYYDNAYSVAVVGSRLYLKNSTLALRVGEKFPELLKDFHFIPKTKKVSLQVKKGK